MADAISHTNLRIYFLTRTDISGNTWFSFSVLSTINRQALLKIILSTHQFAEPSRSNSRCCNLCNGMRVIILLWENYQFLCESFGRFGKSRTDADIEQLSEHLIWVITGKKSTENRIKFLLFSSGSLFTFIRMLSLVRAFALLLFIGVRLLVFDIQASFYLRDRWRATRYIPDVKLPPGNVFN